MNRHETIDLLKLRMSLTEQRYNTEQVDTWAEMLATTDRGEAVVAMRRVCATHAHVNWFQFHAEIQAHRHGKTNRADTRPADCDLCAGTGWREADRDHAGNTTVEPCTHHVPAGREVAYAQGIAIAAAALADELAARGRDPSLAAARIDRWFR